MLNKKTMLATGIVLLFIILSISPATANIFENNLEIESLIFNGENVLRDSIKVSEKERLKIVNKISSLMNNLQSEKSYLNIFQAIREFDDDSSVLNEMFDGLDIGNMDLPSLGKRVFIVSHGQSNIINPFRKFHINLLRPATLFWYYSGSSDRIIMDKTIIIDPYPLDINILDGRQVGIMRRFVGMYIYIPGSPGSSTAGSNVFFIGYARNAFGLDLSPFD